MTASSPSLPAPAADWALFLDVDGTLVEIAAHPQEVQVGESVRDLLSRLLDTYGGAVALVSGRSLRDLDALFAPLKLPGAGQHGSEWRHPSGEICRLEKNLPDLAPVVATLTDFAEATPGIVLEEKGLALALHYRQAPEMEDTAKKLVHSLCDGLENMHVLEGKCVLEIKPKGTDKGTVVRTFMAEAPFYGRRPVFIGDDVTDEDGFIAVNALQGHSIRVGNNTPTAARWQIDSVSELSRWLTHVAAHAISSKNHG